MQRLLISDTNIFIDMKAGKLVEEVFQLPFNLATPDILFQEELSAHHSDLTALGLTQMELNSTSMIYVGGDLANKYPKESFHDRLALALAKQESCILLTGDKGLRTAAKVENVECHGTIWIIERLIDEQIIGINRAFDCYDLMKTNGRRLDFPMARGRLETLRPDIGP